MTYYTISDAGCAEIVAFLNRYHKNPTLQRIDAWVASAETNMNNNSHATIEIPFFDATSGHVESLTLEGDALTINDEYVR